MSKDKKYKFNGLSSTLNDITLLSNAKSRSISPENLTGEPGKGGMATLENGTASFAARDLGQGWKVNPFIHVKSKEKFVMADIEGPGAIQHIWLTPTGNWRLTILRIYWDDQEHPSVEAPIGDFFGMAYNEYAPLNSATITVNPGSSFNSNWIMPFRKRCRIEIENMDTQDMTIYYQIDYTLTEIDEDAAYFHAKFNRVNPLPYKEVYTILDDIEGKGHYVGTFMGWGVKNNGWWGEGEIKFYIDNDKEFPTINGTGTEDYFLGSYNFENKRTQQYETYSTAYAGLHQVIKSDGLYQSQMKFGMYRWHITDPIRFDEKLKVTIQALGWRKDHRYLPLQDDISSVAYWYQTLPSKPFGKFFTSDELENI